MVGAGWTLIMFNVSQAGRTFIKAIFININSLGLFPNYSKIDCQMTLNAVSVVQLMMDATTRYRWGALSVFIRSIP